MTIRTSLRLALGLAVASFACNEKPAPTPYVPATPPPAPASQPAGAADPHAGMGLQAPAANPGEGGIRGKVLETMDSGGYTYAKIDRGDAQVWAAGPQTKLAVGDQVAAPAGALMTGFRSEKLNRTFDQIYFVGAFAVGAAGVAPAAEAKDPAAAPAHGAVAPAAGGAVEKIEPAAGGTSIAEVYAQKDALSGKPLVVRGKVVKVNNRIMGRNWLHLQDGTGAGPTADLLVTSDAEAAVGDVVVARGTLGTNKDFGGGYKYELVLEGATLGAQ